MRNILLFIIGGIFSIYDSSGQTASYSVIPSPQLVKTTGQDSFHLKKNTTITYPKGNELLKRNAEFLSEYIGQATGNAPMITGFVVMPRAFASANSSKGLVPASLISVLSSISGTM